ncbi:hypothetical protein [Dokdonella sp.]|uniref:hypothetical protein n=1 Tax=Dokdonella sp. TaxID=2291710 RepID=UPI003BAFC308
MHSVYLTNCDRHGTKLVLVWLIAQAKGIGMIYPSLIRPIPKNIPKISVSIIDRFITGSRKGSGSE